MSDRNRRMLSAFRDYETERKHVLVDHSIVGVPTGTRLRRIERHPNGWRIWIATNDYIHGTFLNVSNDGEIVRVTVRPDEGPEYMTIRPSDEHIATQVIGRGTNANRLHSGSSGEA